MSSWEDTNSLGLGGHNAYGLLLSPGNTRRDPVSPVSGTEVVSPSEMMAIGDGFAGGNGTIKDGTELWRTYDLTHLVYPSAGSDKRASARHQGKANVVFCDGHVESPTLPFLFADTSDEALSRWNRDHQPHREKLSPAPVAHRFIENSLAVETAGYFRAFASRNRKIYALPPKVT